MIAIQNAAALFATEAKTTDTAGLMRLWLLTAKDDLPASDNPWPEYQDGRTTMLVLSAPDERSARVVASGHTSVEFKGTEFVSPWLEDRYATCVELVPGDTPAVFVVS